LDPEASLTVTIAASDEVQAAQVVNVCTVLSASVPVAANCMVVPGAMLDGLAGVTAREATADAVSDVVTDNPLYAAVIVVTPVDVVADANPCDPEALLISATAVFEDVQAVDVVTTIWEPFE
jgi:hypothetical protein